MNTPTNVNAGECSPASHCSAIVDENGKPLAIGMRVGCRQLGESRAWSVRGLTLEGYEVGTPQPYITNAGRFAVAIKDHQPEMDEWIAKHVSPNKQICESERMPQQGKS
jgi:hypothetical protein